MIHCPYCGNKLEIETTKFCINCGADLTKSVPKQTPTTPLTKRKSIIRLSPS